ncbi:hypothetical protein CEXT_75341 [Caerostris extrusa]|uniref:Uncharacterized protein n=1 Tax=Caerostris extrusa TaxID=172846 RepID=A0AAV4W2G2_CAEEX|nr:hypothetical protein CEXT_75341 [Caerostris extrusa]
MEGQGLWKAYGRPRFLGRPYGRPRFFHKVVGITVVDLVVKHLCQQSSRKTKVSAAFENCGGAQPVDSPTDSSALSLLKPSHKVVSDNALCY